MFCKFIEQTKSSICLCKRTTVCTVCEAYMSNLWFHLCYCPCHYLQGL